MSATGDQSGGGQVNRGYNVSTEPSPSGHARQAVDAEDVHIAEEDLPCKWGPLTSPCCNVCRNPKLLLFVLCLGSFVQGMMVNGFVNVNVSSWERRFELSSTESGLVVSCYDIAVVLCLIPVTYLGGLGSKPRWLGWGYVILGVAAFVLTIPHFVTDPYQYGSASATDAYCGADNSTDSTVTEACTQQVSSLNNYKYVFIVGMLLFGVGASPVYTLGVTFMDENVKQKWSSMYIGIFYTMAVIGPAVGYVLGGYFLTFYTDFDVVDPSTLNITAVSWIGAWWLGFLIFGGFSVIIGILVLGFPRSLPGAERLRAERVSEAYRGHEGVTAQTAGFGSLKQLPQSLKILVTNPTFMLLNLAGAAEGIVVQGVSTFIPKYVEYQFSVSASYAGFVIGIGTVVGGGLGTLFSGYIIKRLKLSLPGLLKMCMICSAVAVVGQLGLLAKCSPVTFAGISHSYNQIELQEAGADDLLSDCNKDCGCANLNFNPVCGENDVMYFTACAAGCENYTQEADAKVYQNCSCVEAGEGSDGVVSQSATEGRCPADCQLLIVFMLLFVIILFFTFATGISELAATLRCVPAPQHSLSLGVQWIVVRCLGNIPGPVLYGTVIDQACLYWHQPCGDSSEGACYFYSSSRLSLYLLGITMGCKAVGLVLYILAWLLYKPPGKDNTKDIDTAL